MLIIWTAIGFVAGVLAAGITSIYWAPKWSKLTRELQEELDEMRSRLLRLGG
ncbi:MAG: hypothetical protein GY844_14765 [Bradyrhizobium sp.]|nr:hypothetical protein [Bradyrhizobium sp.]